MRRIATLAALVVTGATLVVVAERVSARQNVAEIQEIKSNLYLITGGGGNTAAFVTEEGVVVVDTKLLAWGPAILDMIRSVTDKPVTMIINTHTHGDHVGSNAHFPSVAIVAHENTKTNMQRMEGFQDDNEQFLPGQTYSDRLSLLDGPDRIDLYYFGPGHTDGDTVVVFPAVRAAHMGDLFPAKSVPFIDSGSGGTVLEYPETLAKAVDGISGVDVVIPGHSAVTDWVAFEEYRDFTRDFVAAVERAFKGGKSAEEAAAALGLPDQYIDYGMQRAVNAVTSIYAELQDQ